MQSTRTLAYLFVFSLFLATGMQAAAGFFNKSHMSAAGDFTPDDQRPFDSPDEIPLEGEDCESPEAPCERCAGLYFRGIPVQPLHTLHLDHFHFSTPHAILYELHKLRI